MTMKKIIYLSTFIFLTIFSLSLFKSSEKLSPKQVLAVGDTNPPTVTITNPTSGSNVIAGSQVNITANANDNVGVTSVQFYINGSLLCTDPSPSYSCLWTVPTGVGSSYLVNVKAYDFSSNMGQSYSFVFSVADTIAPTVSITYPTNGGTVTRNSNVTITANSSDNVGVNRVEFYVNGSLKCTDTTSPYSCLWTVPKNRGVIYTLLAKSFDTASNMGQHTITVTSN
jgi:chitinase